MSFSDFSNRDVHNSTDSMFDYNRDGQIDPNEQANINNYNEQMSKQTGRSSFNPGCSGIFIFIIVIIMFISAVNSCADYMADSDDRKRDRDDANREEEFDKAQTVNYFYDDGTESDPDNSYDDKYDIEFDKYYRWEYEYQDSEDD